MYETWQRYHIASMLPSLNSKFRHFDNLILMTWLFYKRHVYSSTRNIIQHIWRIPTSNGNFRSITSSQIRAFTYETTLNKSSNTQKWKKFWNWSSKFVIESGAISHWKWLDRLFSFYLLSTQSETKTWRYN